MTKKDLRVLIKVYEEEKYADDFLNEGAMYMKTLREFKAIEDGEIRGDAHEGVIAWHQPHDVKVTINSKDIDGNEKIINLDPDQMAGPVIIGHNGLGDINIFCLYAFCINDFNFQYDEKDEASRLEAEVKARDFLNAELAKLQDIAVLGEHAVVIADVRKFFSLLDEQLGGKEFFYKRGIVNYFDPKKFSGFFEEGDAIFQKRDSYSNQSEYRVAFRDDSPPEAKLVKLGSLKNIAVKVKVEDLQNLISFKFN
ncbi:hypothetical protein [Comamonas jiangduensis]|uniref:Uncharacterized protein n=1 Tax=Comamonas jiangduensis TaxID=1194168 RepID=A0ABV4IBH7_9BURK